MAMTKKDIFEKLIEIVKGSNETEAAKEEIINRLEKEIEAVSKTKSPTKKEKKRKEENEKISEAVLDALEATNEWMTCSSIMESKEVVDILKELEVEDFSQQRLTSILKGLIEEDFVEKTKAKKKMVYRIITDKPIEGEEIPDSEEEKEIKEAVEATEEVESTEIVTEIVEADESEVEEYEEEVTETEE